jgi:ketosteroid isomerase-like protein
MKRTNVISASLLFVFFFMAGEGFSQTNAEYKAKIETLTKNMAKWMVEGNSEMSLSLYAPDAISMPSYQPMQDGIAAIKAANEAMAGSGMKYNSFELTTFKVIVNGNMINEIGTYKINASIPGMDKPMDDHGKYLTVWEKQKDGSLKIKIETWNSDVDPMAMMSQMGQKEAGK